MTSFIWPLKIADKQLSYYRGDQIPGKQITDPWQMKKTKQFCVCYSDFYWFAIWMLSGKPTKLSLLRCNETCKLSTTVGIQKPNIRKPDFFDIQYSNGSNHSKTRHFVRFSNGTISLDHFMHKTIFSLSVKWSRLVNILSGFQMVY